MRVQPNTQGVLVQRQRDFSAVITQDDPGTKASPRRAAEDFAAIAFVEPMLRQLREANNAAPPFAPGPAERQFGEILDGVLARQITRASNFPLVDRLEADLTRPAQAPTRAPTRAPTGAPAGAQA